MSDGLPSASVAQTLAGRIVALRPGALPAVTSRKCEDLLIDVVGLCITARNEDYVTSALGGCDDEGVCTAIGHRRRLTSAGAAFVNGTAAHGEDFDDTFEGGPVHAGAVVVPAVLAACERHNPDGRRALVGIAVGTEVLCRLSLVVPKAVHKAGFHPTAIFGAIGAAAGVAAALGLGPKAVVDSLGIAGSMAGGIIEYLAEGAWTKRLHAGWAAQSGLRAALLARAGFIGPRTVFEGVHGLFHAFAHTNDGDYDALVGDFGERWVTDALAFKPYPCGTMAQPYIDCARRLAARGIEPEDVKEIVCEVAEGTVHRLWEPLADKQRPPNGYAAKFSTPFILASGFVRGGVGLDAFTEAQLLRLALDRFDEGAAPAAQAHDGGADHCGSMPASRTSRDHFAISARMNAPNSSGDSGAGSSPNPASLALTSGRARLAATTSCSFVTTGLGVPAGATSPCHVVASNPGSPSSAIVASSGIIENRVSVVTASGRTVPALRWPSTEAEVANIISTWPAMTSWSAGAAPL